MTIAPGQASGTRTIHSRFGTRPLTELLQTIFVAELLSPSRCIWLVSPWISDIPIIDNRANGFFTLGNGLDRTHLSLATILGLLLHRGTTVRIATKPDDASRDFLERLVQKAGPNLTRLSVRLEMPLHEKGLLGDGYYLSGSMNFTFNGITINQEAVHYFTDKQELAEQRHSFTASLGGLAV